MIIPVLLWHLIYLRSSLEFPQSSNLLFTVFWGNHERADASETISKLVPPLCCLWQGSYIDMDLPFSTRRHVLPFLRCKQQKLHSQVVKIWYSSNYFWISLFLLDSITVKWYKMTHLAQNEGCKNSTVGYGMKFSIWHYFSQIHIWQFGIFLLNITLFS